MVISLGIGDVSTPLDCLGWSGYRARLLFYIAFPFVLAAFILLVAAWHLRCVMGRRLSPAQVLETVNRSNDEKPRFEVQVHGSPCSKLCYKGHRLKYQGARDCTL